MTVRFYSELETFSDFKGVCSPLSYHPVPNDWHVLVADVAGSTEAIRQGRYKDVNAIGVSCIVAALNASPDAEFPYVFGGDGATLIVHDSHVEAVRSSLLGVANLAERMFELSLRVGSVPIRTLESSGHRVGVARFALSADVTLAMLNGDGVQVAEEWIKAPSSRYTYRHSDAYTASLEGFECRWEPLRSNRGSMMSLIALARDDRTYQELVDFIDSLGGVAPTSSTNLRIASTMDSFATEASLKTRVTRGLRHWFHKVQTLVTTSIGRFLLRIRQNFGGFNGRGYLEQTARQSDFRKFDGVLRMVLDLDDDQRRKLEAYLKSRHSAGELFFGTFVSDHGLLTCLVRDYMGHHVHFVDGGDGGYAMAARALKMQLELRGDPRPEPAARTRET